MLLQTSFPPPALPPDLPPPAPLGPVFQILSLLILGALLVELILSAIPEPWRDKAFEFIFEAVTFKCFYKK